MALRGLRPAAALTSNAGGAGADTAPGAEGLRAQPRTRASAAPVVVVTAPVAADVNPRAPAWGYIADILRRAGLFFEPLAPDRLGELLRRPPCVVVLAGHLPLSAMQRSELSAWVKRGGFLLGVGGTSGLDDLFGVRALRPLAEGWLKVKAGDHPVTRGLRSSLHVFGVSTPSPGPEWSNQSKGELALRSETMMELSLGSSMTALM